MSKTELFFRRFIVWVILVTLLAYWPKRAHADSNTANLSVLVSDSSGAVIAGAHLVLRNSDTSQEQQLDSGKTGSAIFSFLKPGHYALTVSADAFADVIVDRILLNVGDDKLLRLSLKVGTAAQTVNVDGGGLTINTTDASVSTVIDRKFVENIPLNGRSFQDLISMTPGVVTQSPQSGGAIGTNGDFSINGQRTESNYYTVDGVSGNIRGGNGSGGANGAGASGSLAASTAVGTTQSLISVDALQEFRIQSSTYSAEFGRTPGGQLSFVTRSGSNHVHGSAFDYLRNSFFDANDWFNDHTGKPITALRQNDFGGTLGGPILIPKLYDGMNRTFFFFSYEGLRLTQPQAATILYVPDVFLRRQAPTALQPILNAYPLPNGIDYGTAAAPNLAQFIEPYSLPSKIDSTSIRLDHTLSPKLAFFFRFGDTPSSAATRVLSSLTTTSGDSRTYTVGATSQLTSAMNNDFHLGYASTYAANSSVIDAFGGAAPLNIATQAGLESPATSQLNFVLLISGVGSAALSPDNASNTGHQWNIVDTFSISRGHHQLKLGFDYARIYTLASPSTPYVTAAFLSANAVLHDATSILTVYRRLSSQPVFQETSAFFQDEWRVAPQVSLSLGLRWEVDPPPTGSDGKDALTLQGSVSDPSTLTLAPAGTPLWKTTWYNFAPRLGVAWTAHSSQEWPTVVRTGGGVFFDTDNELAGTGFSGLGFTAQKSYTGSPLPITADQQNLAPSILPPYGAGSVYAFPQHLQLPYTFQWNASLQQGLGAHQTLTISYVGANGRRQVQDKELSLAGANPDFSTIVYFTNGVSSNYQALQVQFQRSISRGVQALASYTWSHSIDFGSNDAAAPQTRGNSDFDVRHNFQGGLSWDLPQTQSNKILESLLDRWSLDGRLVTRTAFPITLNGAYLTDPVTGSQYYGNLNLVPNQPTYLYGSRYPGGKAINNAAFALPAGSAIGDAPRNFVRGFGVAQINLAARREFTLHDHIALQFRAEAFNLSNHPNFGYVDPLFTDATFGQATKMLNTSLTTVASQYQQGGPRSMQFALKLLF